MKTKLTEIAIALALFATGILFGFYTATVLTFRYAYATRNNFSGAIHGLVRSGDNDRAQQILAQDIASNVLFMKELDSLSPYGFWFLSPGNISVSHQNQTASYDFVLSEVVPHSANSFSPEAIRFLEDKTSEPRETTKTSTTKPTGSKEEPVKEDRGTEGNVIDAQALGVEHEQAPQDVGYNKTRPSRA
ncbi:MAG: hypothetical protein IAE97_08505 [Chthoniobacterales bacterium]|nr:hypothetical protein [Chthoniobacterales bacterium]